PEHYHRSCEQRSRIPEAGGIVPCPGQAPYQHRIWGSFPRHSTTYCGYGLFLPYCLYEDPSIDCIGGSWNQLLNYYLPLGCTVQSGCPLLYQPQFQNPILDGF
ncbi:unnamed protein product, partial [Discosporangium mesarthrocarpum]